MSSIDNRIVNLKFDNAQFESGTAKTIQTLERLKSALKLDGAAKGMGDLGKGINPDALSKLAQGVDLVKDKFSALSIIGITALANITNKAVDAGIALVKSFGTDQMMAGFSEYELKMGSIQTILANTAKHGTGLDQVKASLEQLNEYADKTIYNFGDMTKNIGLFTNAGIGVEDATSMIKGFSNEAAASGTSSGAAANAAYQLSQALSAGTIRLMDWRSLTNAGMGNKNMQQGLIDIATAMGTFNKGTTTASAAQSDFNGSLEKGWLSADVMSNYLQIMAGDMDAAQMSSLGLSKAQIDGFAKQQKTAEEAATKVRTWTQLVDTLREGVGSSWATTFELLLGDFEQATVLFTNISNALGPMISASGDARNKLLKEFREGGGMDAVFKGLGNIFKGVMSFITPVKEAFAQIFPPKSASAIISIAKGFETLTSKLILNEQGQQRLKNAALLVFGVFKTGGSILSAIVGGIGVLVQWTLKLKTAFVALLAPVVDWAAVMGGKVFSALNSTIGPLRSFGSMLNSLLTGTFGPFLEMLHRMGDALNELLNGDPSKFGAKFKFSLKPILDVGINLANQFRATWKRVMEFLDSTLGAGFRSAANGLNSFGAAIKSIGKFFAPLTKGIKDLSMELIGGLGVGLSTLDFDTVLAALNSGALIAGVTALVKGLGKGGIKSAFKQLIEDISGAVGELSNTLKAMQGDLKANMLLKIAAAIGILAASLVLLTFVDPDKLISASIAMATMAGILMGSMAIFSKIAGASGSLKLPVIAAGMIVLAAALLIMAVAVQKLGSMSWEQLAFGLGAVMIIMGGMLLSAKMLIKMGPGLATAAGGLVIMAVAISLVAAAVVTLGLVPLDVLIQGMVSLVLILGALTVAAILLSKFAPTMILSAVGLVAMALALNMLIVPITLLGLMPFDVLVQGIGAIAVMLLVLVGAALLLSLASPAMLLGALGLVAMAIALNLLVAPIMLLGAMPMDVLVQGIIAVGAALLVLVGVAMLMTTAVVGALGIIAMAAAIMILAVAIAVLAAVGMPGIMTALLGLALAFALLGAAGLVLGPLSPILMVMAAAMIMISGALLIAAVAVMIFAAAALILGPALVIASAGIQVLATTASMVLEHTPALMALGAALIIFGAGAIVAGAGALILGVGLIALAVGLLLVAAVGPAGAIALAAIIPKITELMYHIPGMLAMGAAFLTLGAAIAVLGAALLIFGVAAILTATGLAILVGLGVLAGFSITQTANALQILVDKAGGITGAATSLTMLGGAMMGVAKASQQAYSGLTKVSSTLARISVSLALVSANMLRASATTTNSTRMMTTAMTSGATMVNATSIRIAQAFTQMAAKIQSTGPRVGASTTQMIAAISRALISGAVQVTMANAKIVQSFTKLASDISRTSPQSSRAATSMVQALVRALVSGVAGVTAGVAAIIRAISLLAGRISSQAGSVASAGARIVGGLRSSLVGGLSSISGSVSSQAYQIGINISQGMARGVRSGSGAVSAAARSTAQSALASAKSALAVASPSKKAAEIGGWFSLGLAGGITSKARDVEKSSSGVATSALDVIRDAARSLNDLVDEEFNTNPVITPTMDLSQIQDPASALRDLSYILGGTVDPRTLASREGVPGQNGSVVSTTVHNSYTQEIVAPKALDADEIYRQSKTLFASAKGKVNSP